MNGTVYARMYGQPTKNRRIVETQTLKFVWCLVSGVRPGELGMYKVPLLAEEKRLSALLTELRIDEAAWSIAEDINRSPHSSGSKNCDLPEAELHAMNMTVGEQLNRTTPGTEQDVNSISQSLHTLNSPGVSNTELICSACLGYYKHPKILPCLHTFCAGCIKNFDNYKISRVSVSSFPVIGSSSSSLLNLNANRKSRLVTSASPSSLTSNRALHSSLQSEKDSSYVVCPLCNRGVRITNDLVTNYVIERKLLLGDIDSSDGVRCGLCVVNEDNHAVSQCLDCEHFLCAVCSSAHLRQRGTNDHKLVNLKIYDTHRMSAMTSDCLKCQIHPSEKVKMYCESCEVLACRKCVMTKHHDHVCNFISDIQESEIKKINRVLTEVEPLVDSLKYQKKHLTDVSHQVVKDSEKVRNEVNAFIDSHIRAVESHRKLLLSQIDKLSEKKLQEIERRQDISNFQIDGIEKCCDFVRNTLKEGSENEILQLKPNIMKQLIEVKNQTANDLQSQKTDEDGNWNMEFCHQLKGDVIENFQMFGRILDQQQPCQVLCTLTGNGFSTARVSHKSRMTLKVVGRDGRNVHTNLNSIHVSLICSKNRKSQVPVRLLEGKDDGFHVLFCPDSEGPHILTIAVCGKAINGSPFKFNVKARWRDHPGVWQCCTFCSTGGRRDVPCACGCPMPGYLGCDHNHGRHPGAYHWSCCGKMAENSECLLRDSLKSSEVREVTL
ncbi:hypothetical protein ScPMuIL_010231 [Solemya velum]